jgi:hypothetical protein
LHQEDPGYHQQFLIKVAASSQEYLPYKLQDELGQLQAGSGAFHE